MAAKLVFNGKVGGMSGVVPKMFVVACLFALAGCEKPYTEELQMVTVLKNDYESPQHIARCQGLRAARGRGFSTAAVPAIFTEGIYYAIPDSLIGTDLRIYFSCWVRIDEACLDPYLSVNIHSNSDLLIYRPIVLRDKDLQNNMWVHFADSTQYPAFQNTERGVVLKVFGVNNRPNSRFDMDELQVTLKVVHYVPRSTH